MFTAEDFMSSPAVTITSEATVATAVTQMRQHRISSLLVEPTESGQSYGIVTKRDVVTKVVANDGDPQAITVAEIMSSPVVTVPRNCTLRECSSMMSRAGFRRLPVFQDGEPVGIISDTDIFAAVEEAGWGPEEQRVLTNHKDIKERLAAKLTGHVPHPEVMAESILMELEQ